MHFASFLIIIQWHSSNVKLFLSKDSQGYFLSRFQITKKVNKKETDIPEGKFFKSRLKICIECVKYFEFKK